MSFTCKHAVIVAIAATILAPAHAEPVAFTDMLGNPVTLKEQAERVVTLPMPASSLLMSLDGGPAHLVGMHPAAHELMQGSPLARIFPAAANIRSDVTRSGFAPNVETLLQIQPDLVWQWGYMGDDLIAPLRNAGLPVAALLNGSENRTREWIRLMGISLGRQTQANSQLQWREQVRRRIESVTATIDPEARPRVLYLSRYFPQYRVPGHNTSFEHDIALAGGRNVSSSIANAQAVNAEQILAWNPEVILLNNFERKLTPETIYQDPMLADTPAVRDHRVYKIPAGGYLWDPPNQESPLYWQWLSLILHPDKFDWPIRELIAQAYPKLYGYTPTSADIDTILHMTQNDKAAGYDRFR